MKVRLKKNGRAIGECVRLRFLVKQTHSRSHCIYTGFRMDSHIKNLRVQNGVQIRGPKGGSTFCQHPSENNVMTGPHHIMTTPHNVMTTPYIIMEKPHKTVVGH